MSFIFFITAIPLRLEKELEEVALSPWVHFLTGKDSYLPRMLLRLCWGWWLVGKQLLDGGIQCKREGVVLSPLLVITVIIMEISQQAPETAPFASSPRALWGGLWSVGLRVVSEPVICRGELGWGGSGGSPGLIPLLDLLLFLQTFNIVCHPSLSSYLFSSSFEV